MQIKLDFIWGSFGSYQLYDKQKNFFRLKCEVYFNSKYQVKLSFIVITLHVWTYSGTRCHASQDHGATLIQIYNTK